MFGFSKTIAAIVGFALIGAEVEAVKPAKCPVMPVTEGKPAVAELEKPVTEEAAPASARGPRGRRTTKGSLKGGKHETPLLETCCLIGCFGSCALSVIGLLILCCAHILENYFGFDFSCNDDGAWARHMAMAFVYFLAAFIWVYNQIREIQKNTKCGPIPCF